MAVIPKPIATARSNSPSWYGDRGRQVPHVTHTLQLSLHGDQTEGAIIGICSQQFREHSSFAENQLNACLTPLPLKGFAETQVTNTVLLSVCLALLLRGHRMTIQLNTHS